MKFILALAATMICWPSPSFADDKVPGTSVDGACGLLDSVDEIVDKVEDLFGSDRADEIRDLLNDANDPVGVVEIGYGYGGGNPAGDHDRDTVGLNTQAVDCQPELSSSEAALVLEHEMEHVEGARAAGEGFDPGCKGDCGSCEHAKRHWGQICRALAGSCERLSCLDTDDQTEACNALTFATNIALFWSAQCLKKCPAGAGDHAADRQCAESALASCCPL